MPSEFRENSPKENGAPLPVRRLDAMRHLLHPQQMRESLRLSADSLEMNWMRPQPRVRMSAA